MCGLRTQIFIISFMSLSVQLKKEKKQKQVQNENVTKSPKKLWHAGIS